MNYNFSKIKERGEGIKECFNKETASLRTGRATPILVEDILVTSYGAKTPLKHVAAISVDDARTLRISPWDTSVIKDIEIAIAASPLGIQPLVDQQTIRVVLPELSEERRKSLVKILSDKLEESRISIKKEREEIWRDIQDKEKSGELSEDEKFRLKDELQKIVDDFNKDLENMSEKKRSEIMQ